ncbi:MAG: glycosyltransferase family 2 protein [Agriterribacter sp.]
MAEEIRFPWVSFCISTFKRPDFLHQQLSSLLKQTFTNFEIVISDNDPEGSAGEVCLSFKDNRIRYFHNQENLGMIKSFNKSIERARTDFIVMVTDDDPVDIDFLSTIYNIWLKNPNYGIYGGFERKKAPPLLIEHIKDVDFISEILDPSKTSKILWSSCVLKKDVANEIGKIPDYGSPHLADHAFIALIGDKTGGIVINKMYSFLTSHNNNFSKVNLEYYLNGCKGFYEIMLNKIQQKNVSTKKNAIDRHLKNWIIVNVYSLKKYYTITAPNKNKLSEINSFTKGIMRLPFMRKNRFSMQLKEILFKAKLYSGILKSNSIEKV